MNIAELQGEKTVKTLARRLLAEPSKDTPKTTQAEMEATLLRLNPQLNKIGDLEKGTPIIVPDGFSLDPAQSVTPTRGLAEELLQRAENALADLRSTIKEQTAQEAERTERVLTWAKSDQAKELGRQLPQLKEFFSSVASAGKTSPKEQAAAAAAEDKALEKVKSQLAAFRVQHTTNTGPDALTLERKK